MGLHERLPRPKVSVPNMAHAVVAIECHHGCSSQPTPGMVSVVTTTAATTTTTSMGGDGIIGSGIVSAARHSRSSSIDGYGGDDDVLQRRPVTSNGSIKHEPNAIVTITSVSKTVPVVPAALPSLSSRTLVVPNITIASINQPTTLQMVARTLETPPTSKPSIGLPSITKPRIVPVGGSDRTDVDGIVTAYRLRSVDSVTEARGSVEGGTNLSSTTVDDGDLSNIIVVETNLYGDNRKSEPVGTDFDPAKDLEWLNGVTTLPGSNLKFRYNEFGVMELITDADATCDSSTGQAAGSSSSRWDPTSTRKTFVETAVTPVRLQTRKRKRSVPPNSFDAAGEGLPDAEKVLNPSIAVVGKTVGINAETLNRGSEIVSSVLLVSDAAKAQKMVSSNNGHAMQIEEPSKDSSTVVQPAPIRVEKRGRPLGSKNANSSKKFKSIFSWAAYLEQTKTVAAPLKCFVDAFPCTKNGFRVGMKLEAVDPVHQSLFCVVTVAEIRGFRLRLHFDGFSDCYDFWVNADSSHAIFRAGWCEKFGHQLQPPKGFTKDEFNWTNYLKQSKALAAPKHLFASKSSKSVIPHGFRVGMKLEAVDKKTVLLDRKNSSTSLVCVATIVDVMDSKILVHFDGWDAIYDYWADPTSPYIHPVGWCQEKGHVLMPPNKCKDPEHFTWEAYLAKSRSQAAPARSFKQRPANLFKRGMKLEAVDPRNQSLIRVATVADVGNHQVKIHFDGWSDTYDFWVDADNPDIHPVSWCEKTGHPLEPPPSKDYCVMISGQGSGCPTPGCQGVGHIRGPKYTTHHSSFGCPYSHSNLSKDMGIPDRVKSTKEPKTDSKKPAPEQIKSVSALTTGEPTDQPATSSKDEALQKSASCPTGNPTVAEVSCGEESNSGSIRQVAEEVPPIKLGRGRPKRKDIAVEHRHQPAADLRFGSGLSSESRTIETDELLTSPPLNISNRSGDASSDSNSSLKSDSRSSLNSSMTSTSVPASIASELSSIVHRSIFMPSGNDARSGSGFGADTSASFRRHAKLLPGLARLRGVDVGRWTVDQVTDFVRTLPGCQDVAKAFKDEQIDGEAFVLLNQADIVNLMNIKLGPALKIYNSIVMLHHMTAES